MTVFNATERRSHTLSAVSHGGSYSKKNLTASIELAAQATFPHTITFGHVPSNARLLGSSMVYFDKLAAATTTLDLGLGAVDGNLANADDPDALSNGTLLTSASTGTVAITLFADYGNEAWDFVASETTDPGGALRVYGTVADALTSAAGTITLSLDYVID
jgi:hypothetical protein